MTDKKVRGPQLRHLWSDRKKLEALSRHTKLVSVVGTVLVGLISLILLSVGSDPRTPAVAAITLLLGLVGLGLYVCDARTKRLEKLLKSAPPKVRIDLQIETTGRFFVQGFSETDVPFRCQWVLTTKGNRVLTGAPLDWAEFWPKPEQRAFSKYEDFDPMDTDDGYVELRFDFVSLYSAELGDPRLAGTIIRRYRVSDQPRGIVELPATS